MEPRKPKSKCLNREPAETKKRQSRNECHSTSIEENKGEEIKPSQQWRILSSTCLVAFTVIGLTQSFGVFQAYYMTEETIREGILSPRQMTERALISAIGSLGNGGIVAVFGILYYPRLPLLGKQIGTLCGFGTACVAIGLATAVTSRNIWTLLACQGLLVGLGGGIMVYILGPILPEYFPHRSGLAQGCMYSSASLGGLVWSFALTELLETLGIRKTLGILAGCSGLTLSVASALALPPRRFEKRDTKILGWTAFKDPLFLCLAVVNLSHPLTVAIPFTFGPEYAESLGVTTATAAQLLAINSGVGIPARLATGFLADSLGHQNVLALSTAIYAVAIWALWLPSTVGHQFGLYIALSVCHGLVNGVFVTVSNSVQKQLFGEEKYFPKSGALTTLRGIGCVVGVPIAGALVTKVTDQELRPEDFTHALIYAGSLVTASFLCLVMVRWLDAKRTGWKWQR